MGLEIFPNQRNFIKSMISHPCARPWFVYAETFLPAFLKLFLTVALFDVEDAIRAHGESIVREGGGKGGKRHSPRIKANQKKNKIDRYAMKGLKFLLVVTEPLEKIGFLWLLYSATDEFFFDWQTLLEESGYCQTTDATGPLTLSRGPTFISLVIGGIPVILNVLDQNRASWSHSSIGATIPNGRFTAVFSLTVKGPLFGITGLWIQLRTPAALGAVITRSETIALAEGEEGSLVVRHSFNHPTVGGGALTWEIGGATIPAGIESVKGFMSVWRVQL